MTKNKFAVATLTQFLSDLFHATGVERSGSDRIASALVDADLHGKASHGVLQAEAYLRRLQSGSMRPGDKATIVSDKGAAIVMDAGHILGHLAAEHGMQTAIDRAKQLGVGVVAMRNGYHSGVNGRYVKMATEQGCIGLAMCNTKSVAPAIGGAEKLVGTNPLAIGLPTDNQPPIIFDMATTAGSIGKIRQAGAADKDIPEGWAVDADGNPTTDPAAALKGMILPASGAKGFGLSLCIDLMGGILSGGGWGPYVGEMRGDLTKPYNGSMLFIAINIEHFRALDEFTQESQEGADRVRNSKRADGVDRLYAPGERGYETAQSNDGFITLGQPTVDALRTVAGDLNIEML